MALVEQTHPADIKAAICKRYRTMAAFERAEGLATGSVSQILRGRPSKRTTDAIERVLRERVWQAESINLADTLSERVPHRLNAEAR